MKSSAKHMARWATYFFQIHPFARFFFLNYACVQSSKSQWGQLAAKTEIVGPKKNMGTLGRILLCCSHGRVPDPGLVCLNMSFYYMLHATPHVFRVSRKGRESKWPCIRWHYMQQSRKLAVDPTRLFCAHGRNVVPRTVEVRS